MMVLLTWKYIGHLPSKNAQQWLVDHGLIKRPQCPPIHPDSKMRAEGSNYVCTERVPKGAHDNGCRRNVRPCHPLINTKSLITALAPILRSRCKWSVKWPHRQNHGTEHRETLVRAAVKRLSQAEYSNDNDLRFSLASASMKTLGKACSEKRRLDRADRVCKAADDPSEAEARAVVKIGSKQTKVRKSQMKPRHILVVVDASRNVSQRHSLFVTTSVVLPTPPSCA